MSGSGSSPSTACDLSLSFQPTQRPLWRRTDLTTREMLDRIVDHCTWYDQLPQHCKSLVMADEHVQQQAYADFLFQVNKIEKEGFDTYAETRDAIRKGALSPLDGNTVLHTDSRLESMCCLYRALQHWLMPDHVPLSIQELEQSHRLLLGSTKPDIAGRIRTKECEVVYVETEEEPGFHLFMWPTEVRPALLHLLQSVESEIAHMQEGVAKGQIAPRSKIELLLKLGGAFFLTFENIHPFMDGNGRCGRILLACLLQSVIPFPNVLFVDSPNHEPDCPPFVNPIFYYDCFQTVQSQQKFEIQKDGHPLFTKEAAVCTLDFPEDLTALIIEGVYVGWKRFFRAIDESSIGGAIMMTTELGWWRASKRVAIERSEEEKKREEHELQRI